MKKNIILMLALGLSKFCFSETLFIKESFVESNDGSYFLAAHQNKKSNASKHKDFSFSSNDVLINNLKNATNFIVEQKDFAQSYLMSIGQDKIRWLGPQISKTINKDTNHKDVSVLRSTISHLYPEYKERLFPAEKSTGWQDSVMDNVFVEVVKELQERWGIKADGVVSKHFYFNLYLTNAQRIEILNNYIKTVENVLSEVKSSGQARVMIVNVPSFHLTALGAGERVESSVIVGSTVRRTPLGKMKVWGIKLNPDWTPPPGIMSKDVLPAIENGKMDVLKKKGLVITDSTGSRMSLEELSGLSKADVFEMGLRFRQPAGDFNALGLLKFETDSKDNIYLHDTNDRKLFDLSHRALSSGCIRVKEWKALGAWSLQQSSSWVDEAISFDVTKVIKINNPIDVYVINEQVDYINGKWVFYSKVY